ncbi:hypothetical protein V6N13_083331 [Hibiscus sabdariffa]
MSRGAEQTTNVHGTRAHQQITTVFVDNISPALHWQGLWHAFARHGNVVDAFIARKLSRGGRRFGFVRFEKKTDAWRVIERLNGFSLFGQRISVTLAHNNGRTQNWKKVRQDNTKKLTQDQPGERTPYSGDNRKETEGENITKNRKVYGHVEDEDLWKMRRCLVGEAATICSANSLEDRLRSWGLGEIKVQRMGGRMFLITIEDEELYTMMEGLEWSYLKEIFVEIYPWSENISIQRRVTWLEAGGVPLHCWNNVTFNRIVELWGKVEALGENVFKLYDCEKFTLLISTSQMTRIEEVIDFEVGNMIHEIRVTEVGFSDCRKRIQEEEVKSNKERKKINVENMSMSESSSETGEKNSSVAGLCSREPKEEDAINEFFFGKVHQDVEGCGNNDVNRLMEDIELMGVGLDDSIIKTNEKSGAMFVGNMDHVEILKGNKSGNDRSWVQAVLKQVDGDKVLLEEDDVGLVTNGKVFECPNSGPLLAHDPKKV